MSAHLADLQLPLQSSVGDLRKGSEQRGGDSGRSSVLSVAYQQRKQQPANPIRKRPHPPIRDFERTHALALRAGIIHLTHNDEQPRATTSNHEQRRATTSIAMTRTSAALRIRGTAESRLRPKTAFAFCPRAEGE